ncbi:UDP-N-acetylglucosamine 2-epimerase (non-hydrolyzing) [Thalassotalea nanhaiensis]|uniref:UDP-N-acetylglucosamine 2-epimerase (Non-hydrolyzing) n=1 Tax=Thalassotalea nanhaiensis TaxID=3065648 RepID=A0ABY9THY2_9GAMM|nr:UDP-N-acetylglucosamine 2-epimerase (non-hydrolyzing) [Colwelliaceae bacterium SQ345]
MKIGIVVGTRPEIIKMAPVIRECQKRLLPFFIIHSNQHYSEEMDKIFFEELQLPTQDYNLNVGSGLHSNQTGNILIKMEPILVKEKPDVVLVQGDTNTVLAGALAASKLNIKVGHIEAGLRSYDRMMPEETNRILTDHISDFLFAVGPAQEAILIDEGISNNKIYAVGNTVSDSLFQHLEISQNNSSILESLKLDKGEYFLITAHRASNVDIKSHLEELLVLLTHLHQHFFKPIVWPIHPRTVSKLKEFDLKVPDFLLLTPPIGYFDFIQLQQHAKLILTDSGGIQEEACLLGVPCITLRENTERPESVNVGANVLVGRNKELALNAMKKWMDDENYSWENPFGDGKVAGRIISILEKSLLPQSEDIIPRNEDISVIGLGYMGLPIACLLAEAGYQVKGIDISTDRVDMINSSKCPYKEMGLEKLLQKVISTGFLRATTTLKSSNTYLLAVPTPQLENKCDLSFLNKAIEQLVLVARNGQTLIIESTISPGTSKEIQSKLLKHNLELNVVHCPERAIPGNTLFELKNNDRVVGSENSIAANLVKNIYKTFSNGQIFITDTTTAECVKLVENTSRDVNIAFANELAEICHELEVDVQHVINLANKHPRVNVLSPGPGVGGHCIPVDPWFLIENTESGELVRLARHINDHRPVVFADQVKKYLKKINGGKVGILGVAYKADVDDCRESPAYALLQELLNSGIKVKYHDPLVMEWACERLSLAELQVWSDVLLLVTDHSAYQGMKFSKFVINTRN